MSATGRVGFFLCRSHNVAAECVVASMSSANVQHVQAELFLAAQEGSQGQIEQATHRVQRALQASHDDPQLVLLGAHLLFSLRRFSQALAWLDRVASNESHAKPQRVRALDTAFALCLRLGWPREGQAYCERADTLDPGRIQRLELLARLHHGVDNDVAWRESLETIHARAPSTRTAMLVAEARVATCDVAAALETLRPLVEQARHSCAMAPDVVRLLMSAGDASTAWECLNPHLEHACERRADVVMRAARLALWERDIARATVLSDELCALETSHRVMGWMVRGALAVMSGDFARAIACEDQALVSGTNIEALCWKVEALIRQGQHDEAELLAHRAAREMDDGTDATVPHVLLDLLRCLRGSSAPYSERVQMAMKWAQQHGGIASGLELREGLEQLLVLMNGNRSETPTVTVKDDAGKSVTRAMDLARGGRHRAKRAMYSLGFAGREAAERALEGLHEQYASIGLTHNYHGEVLLFLGEFEAAREQFQTALRKVNGRLFWSHVGMGAVTLLHDHDPERAIDWLDRGVATMGYIGTTWYGYRGEALEALGQLEKAYETLEQAVSISPTRVGAWITLARVCFATGRTERAHACVRRLQKHAAALFSDAEDELGMIVQDVTLAENRTKLDALLLHMRAMMKGNRASSVVTYMTRDGQLRLISSRPPLEASIVEDELQRVKSALEKVVSRGQPNRTVAS